MYDVKTIILSLAICNLVLGLELVFFQFRGNNFKDNRYWVKAKAFQFIGWLFLYGRGLLPDFLYTSVGNISLFCGLAYEYWAISVVIGRKPKCQPHPSIFILFGLIGISFIFVSSPIRILIASFVVSILLGLSAWITNHPLNIKTILHKILSLCLWLASFIIFLRALWALASPDEFSLFSKNLIQALTFLFLFTVALTDGFGLLLLTVATRAKDLADAIDFNETIILNSPLPIGVFSSKDECILANESFAELLNLPRNTIIAKDIKSIPFMCNNNLLNDFKTVAIERKSIKNDIEIVTPHGKELWFESRMIPTMINGENHILIQFVDLTERKTMEKELRKYAYYDPLTELPNRRHLLKKLNKVLQDMSKHDSQACLIYIDIDNFKSLNDNYGHDIGDLFLKEFAKRLKNIVRHSDTVARFGGDEFIVLLNGLSNNSVNSLYIAKSITDKIKTKASEEFNLGGIKHKMSASIGLKIIADYDKNIDKIIKEADAAMYNNKKFK